MSTVTENPSSHPQWILFDAHAFTGISTSHINAATAAKATTTKHHTIEVSFRPSPPPLPSTLFVRCPDLEENPNAEFTTLPRIVRAVDDLLLIRVAMPIGLEDCNYYFVYRADTKSPSLMLLPGPYPFCYSDADVGLVIDSHSQEGNYNYTVAALLATSAPDVYDLHRFTSSTGTWLHKKVSVVQPQVVRLPVRIPARSSRLLDHNTSTVVTMGGEHGTMGWVDLWGGILLCDVLCDDDDDDKPFLRAVPLPVPWEFVSCNYGQGVELGCPEPLRGIAFIKRSNGTPCLKLAHLEVLTVDLTGIREESELPSPSVIMRGWTLTTWSNTKMSTSWKDWHQDYMVQSSDVTIDSQLESQLLRTGLLWKPAQADSALGEEERALSNLLVSHPAPGIDAAHEDVVYLMARVKFLHPKSWVLAIDMKNKKLLSAAEFGIERQPGEPVTYCPSTISKYINPDAFPAGAVS